MPEGQSDAVVTQQPAGVQSETTQTTTNPDNQAIAYQKLQGERDHFKHQADLAGDYKTGFERVQTQNEKLLQTNKELENKLAIAQVTSANPHLKDVAPLYDFSGKSVDEINAWGEQMTKAMIAARGGSNTTATTQPSEEAPNVESAKSPTSPAQTLSNEAFAKLSLADKKKYLQSMGL